MVRSRALAALPLFVALVSPAFAAAPEWGRWDAKAFAQAKAQNRLVILDLEAVWCHWCHVMARETYGDPAVQKIIGEHFIALRADQDADPELSSRYGDWGWPATILLNGDGVELAKLRGFVEPDRLAALLDAFVADPTPGPSAVTLEPFTPATSGEIPAARRAELRKVFVQSFDETHAGWGSGQKFIDADSMDYAVTRAETGDKVLESQARRTLDAALALIDPVWGGVYQYSDKNDWSSPHFEKLMTFQAQYLRQYAQSFAHWRDPRHFQAARAIYGYMMRFLRDPEGGFYVSQDADRSGAVDGHAFYALDAQARERLGAPRVDRAIYARENGLAISALATFYDVTENKAVLDAALDAARWIKAHRALEGGGFRHGENDAAGPYLADSRAMGQAFIDLYAATGDRAFLADARAAGRFIAKTFRDPSGGFAPAVAGSARIGALKQPVRQIDDQIAVARFMNLLGRYSGEANFAAEADHALRYAIGASEDMERPLPGLLLAESEIAHMPTHITIVGAKSDPVAQSLAATARAFPRLYRRLDWWDKAEGPLDNPDITYPETDQAAAFACGERQCSLPAFSAQELTTAVARMAALASGQAPAR